MASNAFNGGNNIKKKPEEELPDLSDEILFKRFKIKSSVGKGAHGMVYFAKDL